MSINKCEHCTDIVPIGEARIVQRRDHGHLFINGRDIAAEIGPNIRIEVDREDLCSKITVTFDVAELDIDVDKGVDIQVEEVSK